MGVSLSVRMKNMGGTRYVLEGSNVSLSCEFDLEGDDLYSLLWWRDGSVLLRYTSHGEDDFHNETMAEVEVESEDMLVLDPISNVTTRPLTWFHIKGLKATLGEAGRPQELVLVNVDHNSAGVYTCEVTTEAPPTFLTANTSVTIHVVAIMWVEGTPHIGGGDTSYRWRGHLISVEGTPHIGGGDTSYRWRGHLISVEGTPHIVLD
ncbi:uncharacterized protein LOC122260707 [Penaeus japonicus]|uniref:uncharacterized protein LOC122260707 n=1 Tax=Penaeus japonicus TaxID=27405 RepID=UPI001C715DF9|nr:uncharacterized protein LOC122260707 [Penaeus japonicus]